MKESEEGEVVWYEVRRYCHNYQDGYFISFIGLGLVFSVSCLFIRIYWVCGSKLNEALACYVIVMLWHTFLPMRWGKLK